ncbi:MAG: hypothetical protein ACOYBP_01880 [Microbacteriaceae bacterium]
MATIQLRRYQLGEGQLDAFLDWWVGSIVPIREALGYQVEFAYHLPETNEIVWAARVDGARARWDEIEAIYDASPERIEAFGTLAPGVVLSKELTFVDDVNPLHYRAR